MCPLLPFFEHADRSTDHWLGHAIGIAFTRLIRHATAIRLRERKGFVSPIRSKMEAESWLAERLREEGPDLWRDRQREELARKLAQDYRPGAPKWRVEEWTQRPEGVSVYVVTRGGVLGIHSVDDPEEAREKAEAIVRALDALDVQMRGSGQTV